MKIKMEVGRLTSDKTSFDLDNLEETNSIITHLTANNERKVRWLYKDEANRLVVLEKSEPVSQAFSRGTRLKISKVDGVAAIKHSEEKTQETTIAKLAIDIDFENPGSLEQRTFVDSEGNDHVALLCPVILL